MSTATTPISILLYGKDLILLETRQWILEKHGHHVSIATDLAGVKRAATEETLDLLVLCHSLSIEECGRAIAIALVRSPRMQTLVLAAPESNNRQRSGYQVLDTREGPAKLVSRVGELVRGGSHAASVQH